MPTYEYFCQACGHELETFQRMSDPPLRDCPACAAPKLKRKIGRGAGIIFKGGGFYETDFKDKKGSKEPPAEAKTESKAESKTESKTAAAAEKTS